MMTLGSCRSTDRSTVAKVKSMAWIDLHLVDHAQLVFHGIFDGDNVFSGLFKICNAE